MEGMGKKKKKKVSSKSGVTGNISKSGETLQP